MKRPMLNGALGSYPDREEFQVDRTIVWVQITSGSDRDESIRLANDLFEELWREVPRVLSCAQQASRADIPNFWFAHDKAGTSAQQLAVWGIWIDPQTESAEYEVNKNHNFAPVNDQSTPEYPDGMFFMVARDAAGKLDVEIIR